MLEHLDDSQIQQTNYFEVLASDEPAADEPVDPYIEAMAKRDLRKAEILSELGDLDRINRAAYFQDTKAAHFYSDSFHEFTPPPLDDDPDVYLLW